MLVQRGRQEHSRGPFISDCDLLFVPSPGHHPKRYALKSVDVGVGCHFFRGGQCEDAAAVCAFPRIGGEKGHAQPDRGVDGPSLA